MHNDDRKKDGERPTKRLHNTAITEEPKYSINCTTSKQKFC